MRARTHAGPVFRRPTCPGPVLTAGDPTLSRPRRGHQGTAQLRRVAHTGDRSGGGQTPCPSRRIALGQSADVPVNSRRTPLGVQGPQEPRRAVGAQPGGGSLRAGRTPLRAAGGWGDSDSRLGETRPSRGSAPRGRQLCHKGSPCSCLSDSDLEGEVLAGIQPREGGPADS